MWQFIVFTRVIFAYIVGPVVLKKITVLPSRTRRLSWQFGFCAIISWILILVIGDFILDKFALISILIISFLGIFNSFGAYCQWRAYDINVSKTALSTQADDLIAITLGYLFLRETQYLNPTSMVGVIICVCVAIVLSSIGKTKTNIKLLKWIAGYSVIWGVAVFLMRWFAVSGVPLTVFLVAWYTGSFIGSIIIGRLAGIRERGNSLSGKGIAGTLFLAVLVFLCMFLGYASLRLAPITFVQPIFQVSEIIFPVIIGLWFFREGKGLSRTEKILFAIGAIGIVLIAIA